MHWGSGLQHFFFPSRNGSLAYFLLHFLFMRLYRLRNYTIVSKNDSITTKPHHLLASRPQPKSERDSSDQKKKKEEHQKYKSL
jgi:hypothetical protein